MGLHVLSRCLLCSLVYFGVQVLGSGVSCVVVSGSEVSFCFVFCYGFVCGFVLYCDSYGCFSGRLCIWVGLFGVIG